MRLEKAPILWHAGLPRSATVIPKNYLHVMYDIFFLERLDAAS